MQFRIAALALLGAVSAAAAPPAKEPPVEKIQRSDQEWAKTLSPAQFCIMRQKGTEAPFQNAFWNHHATGTYVCAACGLELFGSDAKFDSKTGWPSFWKPAADRHVSEADDDTFGLHRTEALCARCGAHLGHVFQDGPPPTGLRYCINSAALKFRKAPGK